MANLSRPYQIALAAVALLGLIWVLALRTHSSNTSEPAPRSPSSTAAGAASGNSAPNAAAQARAAATPTPIYHGAAPGVEGLSRAVAKAHGAVALSQQNAQQLQHKSGEASNGAATAGGTAAVATPAGSTATGAPARPTPAGTPARTIPAGTKGSTKSVGATPARAHSNPRIVAERALAQGKTVVLLVWNPKSTVDVAVHREVGALGRRSKGTVAVYYAGINQIAAFRPVTEVAYVYQTPTILIVNRRGVVSELTGLIDLFALEQAVREVRSAGR